MIIKVVRHKRDFSIVSNAPFRNPDLSLKAKGLLIYFLTRNEDWEIRVEDLLQRNTDGKASIWAGLKELRKAGYAAMKTVRSADGRTLAGRRWIIYEDPQSPRKSVPLKNSATENPRLLNTNGKLNTESANASRTVRADLGLGPAATKREQFINTCCAKLEEHVRKAHRINRNFKRSQWRRDFDALLDELDGDKARLREVLLDYISTEGDFKPEAYCAKTFRDKFDKIERWVRRRLKEAEESGEHVYEFEHYEREDGSSAVRKVRVR